MIHDEEFFFSSDIPLRKHRPLVVETDEDRQMWARFRDVLDIVYFISGLKDADIMFEYELLRREGVPPARRNAALFMKYM